MYANLRLVVAPGMLALVLLAELLLATPTLKTQLEKFNDHAFQPKHIAITLHWPLINSLFCQKEWANGLMMTRWRCTEQATCCLRVTTALQRSMSFLKAYNLVDHEIIFFFFAGSSGDCHFSVFAAKLGRAIAGNHNSFSSKLSDTANDHLWPLSEIQSPFHSTYCMFHYFENPLNSKIFFTVSVTELTRFYYIYIYIYIAMAHEIWNQHYQWLVWRCCVHVPYCIFTLMQFSVQKLLSSEFKTHWTTLQVTDKGFLFNASKICKRCHTCKSGFVELVLGHFCSTMRRKSQSTVLQWALCQWDFQKKVTIQARTTTSRTSTPPAQGRSIDEALQPLPLQV